MLWSCASGTHLVRFSESHHHTLFSCPSCSKPLTSQAHLIAEKVDGAGLLNYDDVTLHSGLDVTYFSAEIPDKGGRRGKAQIKRLLKDSDNMMMQTSPLGWFLGFFGRLRQSRALELLTKLFTILFLDGLLPDQAP